MPHPLVHQLIIFRWLVADIDQQKHRFQALGSMQIILNHLSPLRLDFHICIRITISRQIHQIHRFIDIIKINRLGLSRLG